MLIEKTLTAHTAANDVDNPSAGATFTVVSDDWQDGPLEISLQGIADCITDSDGKLHGWLAPGAFYRFNGTTDERLIAGTIEVSDPKVRDVYGTYNLDIGPKGIVLRPGMASDVRVYWTVRQKYVERPEYTIECKHEVEEVRFLYDWATGQPVANSAGDFFPSEPKMKIPLMVYEITRREWNNPISVRQLYTYSVNSDPWCGAAPGTVLIDSILPKWNGNYWEVKYVLKFKENGWGEKFLDEGLREIENGKRIPITDPSTGTPFQKVVKLDGYGRFPVQRDSQGNPILDAQKKKLPLTDFPGVLYPLANNYYWKYKILPFSALMLPDVFVPVSKLSLQ